jgi:hypothetical protein
MQRFLLGLALAAATTTAAALPAAQATGSPPAEVHRGECFAVDGGPWTDPGGTRLFGHAWGVYYGLGSAVLNHYGGRQGFCEVARAYVARVTEGPHRGVTRPVAPGFRCSWTSKATGLCESGKKGTSARAAFAWSPALPGVPA